MVSELGDVELPRAIDDGVVFVVHGLANGWGDRRQLEGQSVAAAYCVAVGSWRSSSGCKFEERVAEGLRLASSEFELDVCKDIRVDDSRVSYPGNAIKILLWSDIENLQAHTSSVNPTRDFEEPLPVLDRLAAVSHWFIGHGCIVLTAQRCYRSAARPLQRLVRRSTCPVQTSSLAYVCQPQSGAEYGLLLSRRPLAATTA